MKFDHNRFKGDLKKIGVSSKFIRLVVTAFLFRDFSLKDKVYLTSMRTQATLFDLSRMID